MLSVSLICSSILLYLYTLGCCCFYIVCCIFSVYTWHSRRARRDRSSMSSLNGPQWRRRREQDIISYSFQFWFAFASLFFANKFPSTNLTLYSPTVPYPALFLIFLLSVWLAYSAHTPTSSYLDLIVFRIDTLSISYFSCLCLLYDIEPVDEGSRAQTP